MLFRVRRSEGEAATGRTFAFFMDKQEIKNRLEQSGLINRFKGDQKLWQMAFDAYNSATGSKLKPTCGVCFTKVKEWLNR